MIQRAILHLCMLILAVIFVTSVSPSYGAEREAEKNIRNEQLLKVLNHFRVRHHQQPLREIPVVADDLSLTTDGSGGVITGYLSDLDQAFFPLATVVAWTTDSSASTVGFASVDPGGHYRIERLAAGEYYVLAVAEGYEPKFYDDARTFFDATPVSVADGDEIDGIDFKMEHIGAGDGSVSGTVTREDNGSPIGGAFVNLFSPDNPFLYGYAQTNDDGSYVIEGLAAGGYYAQAYAENLLAEFYREAENMSDATVIEVTEPEETKGIDFTLSRGGHIAGRVVNEDGAGIPRAHIQVAPAGWVPHPDGDSTFVGGWGFAVSDEQGNYLVSGLPKGDYIVGASIWSILGNAVKWYDNVDLIEEATPVSVTPPDTTDAIDFVMDFDRLDGVIAGRVLDQDGEPIEGAYIQAFAGRGLAGELTYRNGAVSDKEGNYRIDHLAKGKYLVQASFSIGRQHVQRWWPDAERAEDAEHVIISDSTQPGAVDFALPIELGKSVISGRVFSEDGSALAYAMVEISFADIGQVVSGWHYARTDSFGIFEVRRLPAGTYFARAEYWEGELTGRQWYDHADTRDQAKPIEVGKADTVNSINFDLELQSFYGSAAGKAVDETTGEPIPRAYVELTPKYHDMMMAPFLPWPFYGVTDANGEYRVDMLPEGEYWISIYTDGGFEFFENAPVRDQAKIIEITGGGLTAIDFSLVKRDEGPGTISGQVYDEYHDGLLEIAVIIARPVATPLIYPDSELFFNTVIDEGGHYTISGLPEGEYFVMALAPGYLTEYYDGAFDPTRATPVQVDSLMPATGIDFSLQQMWIEFADGSGGPAVRNATGIFGQVSSAAGQPVNDAVVYLLNENGDALASTRSNPLGRYELTNLPTGRYRVKAAHSAFESSYNGDAKAFEEADLLTLAAGRLEVNFVLDQNSVTSVGGNSAMPLPRAVQLVGNSPNPFNPVTRITFALPEEMHVKISIYNLLGQRTAILLDRLQSAGVHSVDWNGLNQNGLAVPSGVYFYVLQTSKRDFRVKKMTLLK